MTNMMTRELIALALDCIKSLIDLARSSSTDTLRAFRTRARDLPTTMFVNGFAYTLVYVASRSSAKAIDNGLIAKSCSDLTSMLRELSQGLGREEVGYALYGLLLTFLIKSAGLTNAKSFDELVKKAMEDPVLERGAGVIAEWIKRLAEAYID